MVTFLPFTSELMFAIVAVILPALLVSMEVTYFVDVLDAADPSQPHAPAAGNSDEAPATVSVI